MAPTFGPTEPDIGTGFDRECLEEKTVREEEDFREQRPEELQHSRRGVSRDRNNVKSGTGTKQCRKKEISVCLCPEEEGVRRHLAAW